MYEYFSCSGNCPFGIGEELSLEVAKVIKVIRESGLPNRTTSMFTEIEGSWDEVMQVVKEATFVLASKRYPYRSCPKGRCSPRLY